LTAAELTPEAVRLTLEPALAHDSAHDWHHLVRVFNAGVYLAGQAGGPVNDIALRTALLTHDLGVKGPKGNALVGPDQIRAALGPVGGRLNPDDLALAVAAINEHSWSRGQAPTSLESAILQDADRLDAIGAVGVARCLAYAGAHGHPIRDPAGGADAVRHFYDKLLRISDRLHLEASRAAARRRHDFLLSFLAELARDCEEFES
jgi:uncharacterized protein